MTATQPQPGPADTPSMTTCPTLTRLWMLALGGLELDDHSMRLAFRLLDGRRFDG